MILFGLPAAKDEIGSENFAEDGIVQRALRRLRARHPDLLLLTDVCCCEYTSHGHCGVLRDGRVDNDATLEILGRVAVTHADAGRGHRRAERDDGRHGRGDPRVRSTAPDTPRPAILSYAVKYASAYYGPFREAADSAPAFGDRREYQMDPANVREAMLEAALDEAEGADMLMVKPALAYLDVVRAVRERTSLPLVAYNVSGEYSMVKAAARLGWIDERRVVLETLTGMRRAGADAIISYHAKDVAAVAGGGGAGMTELRASAQVTQASERLFAAAQRVLPGGVNSPVRAFRSVGGTPRFIARGEGAWLEDVDGNRYVDLVLSWGPLILGHAHPEVLAAVVDGRGAGHDLRRADRARGAAGRAGGGDCSPRSRWCAS